MTSGVPHMARTVVVQGDDKCSLLAEVLERAGLWGRLDAARQQSGVPAEAFRIFIKPDLTCFGRGALTGTDPELVECLVDLLAARGFTSVMVGAAEDGSRRWLENRSVLALAESAGYRGRTTAGNTYGVMDLGTELIPAGFVVGSVLHGTRLGRSWVEAAFRISFAKCRTHAEHAYALGLENLLGVLPLRDKALHYRARLQPADLIGELLRATPIHFALIDAFVSHHGNAGAFSPQPLDTRTLIAADDPLLADWVAAVKMGIDPFASPVNARVLREPGLPEPRDVEGDLSPFVGFQPVHPLLAETFRSVQREPELGGLLLGLVSVDRGSFPFRNSVLDRTNTVLSWLAKELDRNPAALATVLALNGTLATVATGLEAWRTLFAKDRLRRRELPLGLELSRFQPGDYEAVAGYLEPLERLIASTPPERSGLRWRYFEGSVLFQYSRLIEAPFADFTAKVDICRSVSFMKDYIGGRRVEVARDALGRVIHQAERTSYLPQPNYLVLYGGKPIDVAKLELIRYAPGEQKIFWRTLKSDNGSAEFDDGTVAFTAEGPERTRVSVMARQKFTLPLFFQAANLDLNPLVKDALVAREYHAYFEETLDNFEACYEGREFQIGRPWEPLGGEQEGADDRQALAHPEALERARALLTRGGGLLVETARGALASRAPPDEEDEHGFRHFSGTQAPTTTERFMVNTVRRLYSLGEGTRGFVDDLTSALRRDLGWKERQ